MNFTYGTKVMMKYKIWLVPIKYLVIYYIHTLIFFVSSREVIIIINIIFIPLKKIDYTTDNENLPIGEPNTITLDREDNWSRTQFTNKQVFTTNNNNARLTYGSLIVQ